MLDLHVHVWPHGRGTPTPSLDLLERYCTAATDKGIDHIAITEHSHRFARIADSVLPHWERPRTGEVAEATAHVLEVEGGADLDAYVEALQDAQRQGLPILIGLEMDYLPGTQDAMTRVLADYPFDVLLGSVHWLDEWLFDAYDVPAFQQRWQERDTDDVFAQYVDSVIDLANSGTIDVLAHLDVIKVAGHLASRTQEHEDRLVSALADTDVVIEFSSAGLRKPVGSTYPSSNMLDAVVAAGLGLATASDAHAADQVGDGFAVLRAELDTRGIDTLATFSGRQRLEYQRRMVDPTSDRLAF